MATQLCEIKTEDANHNEVEHSTLPIFKAAHSDLILALHSQVNTSEWNGKYIRLNSYRWEIMWINESAEKNDAVWNNTAPQHDMGNTTSEML